MTAEDLAEAKQLCHQIFGPRLLKYEEQFEIWNIYHQSYGILLTLSPDTRVSMTDTEAICDKLNSKQQSVVRGQNVLLLLFHMDIFSDSLPVKITNDQRNQCVPTVV